MEELQHQGKRFEQWFINEGKASAGRDEQLQALHTQVAHQGQVTQKLVSSFEECSDRISTHQQALQRVAGEVNSVREAVEHSMEKYFSQQMLQIQAMLCSRDPATEEKEQKRAKPSPRE